MRRYHQSLILACIIVPTLTFHSAALAESSLVTIDEWDKKDGSMGLNLSAEMIKTGEISFAVNNITEMKMKHEILIIPKPSDIATLNLIADGTKLDEEKLDGLKEVVELEPGEAKSKAVSLAPGEYLVFCNQAGHFAAGMHHVLTVTP